jgi:large subunit ribosomal protein L8e
MGKVIRPQRKGKKGGSFKVYKHRRIAPPKYRTLDYSEREGYTQGVVKSIVHESGRGAPLAKVQFKSQIRFSQDNQYFLATEGIYTGQKIYCGDKAAIAVGNVLPINKIPEGTTICNIEARVGDRGCLSRCSGTYCTIIGHSDDGSKTRVRLPSGVRKNLPGQCRATVGVIAGGGRNEKPILKAGVLFHKYQKRRNNFPKVRGVTMNPVDHPHGGGNQQHMGKPGTVSRKAPAGQKCGLIAARRTGLIRGGQKVKDAK